MGVEGIVKYTVDSEGVRRTSCGKEGCKCVVYQQFGEVTNCGYCDHGPSDHKTAESNADSKGILRDRCSSCKCSKFYFISGSTDCGYCGHAEGAHAEQGTSPTPTPPTMAAPPPSGLVNTHMKPEASGAAPLPMWMLENEELTDELNKMDEEEEELEDDGNEGYDSDTESTDDGLGADGASGKKTQKKKKKPKKKKKQGGMFKFSAKKLAKVVAQEQQKMKNNACRVVVVGATGSGKSSLVNEFFGEQVAQTGVGKPVTQDFQHFEPTDQRPVHLYDSKGFERQDLELRHRTEEWVRTQQALDNVSDRLHVVWYVLDCGSARWLDADTEFCRDVFSSIPVIVVLHKADLQTAYDLEKIGNVIRQASIPNLYAVVKAVSVQPRRGPERCPSPSCQSDDILFYMSNRHFKCRTCGWEDMARPFGHADLLKVTMEVLPGAVKQSFRAAQMASMHEKYLACAHIVSQSAKLSFVSGSIPFPHVDELSMNIVQVRQIVKIALQFGVQPQLVVGVGGAVFAAQFIIGQPVGWVKWIPVVGTAAGITWAMPFYAITSIILGLVFSVVLGDLAKWIRDYAGDGLSENELIASYLRDIDYKKMLRIMWRKVRHERKPNRAFFAQFIENTPVEFKTPNGQPSFLARVKVQRTHKNIRREEAKATSSTK